MTDYNILKASFMEYRIKTNNAAGFISDLRLCLLEGKDLNKNEIDTWKVKDIKIEEKKEIGIFHCTSKNNWDESGCLLLTKENSIFKQTEDKSETVVVKFHSLKDIENTDTIKGIYFGRFTELLLNHSVGHFNSIYIFP